MAFSAKKKKSLSSWRSTTGRCSVPPPPPLTLFLVYINDILTTLSKRVSSTLHADELAIWSASEHTTTATYRIQEAISGISQWTLDWGLEINTSKTNSTLFSLSTSKKQIKLRLKDEIVPQTDTPTFLGVKLDTRLTWKPQIEKMERSSLQKLALMRKLAGTSWGADSSILTKVYTTTVRPTLEYASTAWGTAAKTNKSRLDKVQNMALRVILGAMKTTPAHDMEKTANVEPLERRFQNPHSGRKTKKAAFPPSTHKPGTAHQKSPQTPKPEPPVQRTVQDTPRHCGCANTAADRSCLEARQRNRHTHASECPRHHLKGTAPWRAQKPHACPDRWQIPSHCLDSCLHWWVCWGGDEKWWQRSQHQILRGIHHFSLGSWWPSVLQLSSWDTGYLYSCRAPVGELEKMGNIAIFIDSLSTLQALNSADPDQMI